MNIKYMYLIFTMCISQLSATDYYDNDNVNTNNDVEFSTSSNQSWDDFMESDLDKRELIFKTGIYNFSKAPHIDSSNTDQCYYNIDLDNSTTDNIASSKKELLINLLFPVYINPKDSCKITYLNTPSLCKKWSMNNRASSLPGNWWGDFKLYNISGGTFGSNFNVKVAGNYTFRYQATEYGTLYVDGAFAFKSKGNLAKKGIYLSKGTHTIRIKNNKKRKKKRCYWWKKRCYWWNWRCKTWNYRCNTSWSPNGQAATITNSSGVQIWNSRRGSCTKYHKIVTINEGTTKVRYKYSETANLDFTNNDFNINPESVGNLYTESSEDPEKVILIKIPRLCKKWSMNNRASSLPGNWWGDFKLYNISGGTFGFNFNVKVAGNYTFRYQATEYGTLYVDGAFAFKSKGNLAKKGIYLSKGTHTIRIKNNKKRKKKRCYWWKKRCSWWNYGCKTWNYRCNTSWSPNGQAATITNSSGVQIWNSRSGSCTKYHNKIATIKPYQLQKLKKQLNDQLQKKSKPKITIFNRWVVKPVLYCDTEIDENWIIKQYNENSILDDGEPYDITNSNNKKSFEESKEKHYSKSLAKGQLQISRDCYKEICPVGFEREASTSKECKLKIIRPRIKKFPKTLYIPYNANGIKPEFEVPDLDDYFKGTNLEYDVKLDRHSRGDLEVSIIDYKKLTIASKNNAQLTSHFKRGNNTSDEFFTLIVKQPIATPGLGGEYLIMKFKIKVVLLNSVYNPSEQELYECQALSEED